jgi:hypothetical protein
MIGSEISVADLLCVGDQLGADWIERAAEMLDLRTQAPRSKPEVTTTNHVSPILPSTHPGTAKADSPKQTDAPRRVKKTPELLPALSSKRPNVGPPSWLTAPESRTVLVDAPGNVSYRPPHEPLFAKHLGRNILATSASVARPVGEIDLEQVITKRVVRKPIEPIPLLIRPSLRHGAHVLLDRRKTMMPFFMDQNQLAGHLRAVVGRESCRIFQFFHNPELLAPLGETETRKFSFPLPGTPILLVTDLGIADLPRDEVGVEPVDWIGFGQRAREVPCPVIAFVPYRNDRWPNELEHMFRIIHWDRATTVSELHRRDNSKKHR